MPFRRGEVDALVFDLGNVLLPIDFGRAFASWGQAAGIPAGTLAQRFSFDEAYCAHERGELDAPQYFARLRGTLGVALSDAELLRGWNAVFLEPLPEVVELVHRLARTMPLYVFTNTNHAHIACWKPRCRELLAPFRQVICSCELGCRKPEVEAFQRVARIAGLPACRIGYIDDLEENVAGARAAGFVARHAVPPRGALDLLPEDLHA